ncbi:MAG: acetyl-CoA carboxylase biotin carboxyl carrier protein [Candidatus Izemoplasmataceae bacterium]
MDIKQIKRIMKEFEESNVHKLEISENEFTIKLEKETPQLFSTVPPQPQVSSLPGHSETNAGSEVTEEKTDLEVNSPIVGTYYSKPSPTSDPFVTEGDKVLKGQVLFIVEAMKVMNEIVAPRNGVVKKIFKQDGDLVEFQELVLEIL